MRKALFLQKPVPNRWLEAKYGDPDTTHRASNREKGIRSKLYKSAVDLDNKTRHQDAYNLAVIAQEIADRECNSQEADGYYQKAERWYEKAILAASDQDFIAKAYQKIAECKLSRD